MTIMAVPGPPEQLTDATPGLGVGTGCGVSVGVGPDVRGAEAASVVEPEAGVV
jgi:hypothetical protein